ncbi:hypothetical protein GGI17_004672 [Coemansia sp. S146]|nr:hypothetical protein GGI17_004672 [Coemansia sp. S146]
MGFGSILSKASAALEKSQNKGATATTTTTTNNNTTTTPAANSSGKIDVAQAASLAKTIFGSKSHGSHGHNTTQAKAIDAAADYISKNGSQQQQQPVNGQAPNTAAQPATNGGKIDVAQAAGLAKTIFGSKSHGSHGHNTTQAKAIDAAANYISKNGNQQQQQPVNGQAPNTAAQPATNGGKIDVAQAAGLAKTIFGSKSHGSHGSNSTQAKVIGAAADYISKNGSQQQQQPANGQAPTNNAQPGSSSGKIDVGKLGKLAGKFLNKGH